jgi:hypothetical protein
VDPATGAFHRDRKKDKFDWAKWGAVTKSYYKSASRLDVVHWRNIFDGAQRFLNKKKAPSKPPLPKSNVEDTRACLESDLEDNC